MMMTKIMGFNLSLLAFVGCGSDGTETATQTVNETGTLTTSLTTTPSNPYTEYSGTCPTFIEGTNGGFVSAGIERTLEIRLPKNPIGAPVVVGWHWLGGNAKEIINWLGLDDMVAGGAIVVAPESTGLPYEWDSISVNDSIDASLFDDLLWCLWEQYSIDDDRVFTTGMSAGGIMATFMVVARSEQLAAAAPFSGGVYSHAYQSPADQIPVMLMWGGATDTYGSYSFDGANQQFSTALQADGHFVVECDHGLGHNIPPDAGASAWSFFVDHPKDVSPEPWAAGVPGSMPSYCSLPQ